jgi:hypothetical protein
MAKTSSDKLARRLREGQWQPPRRRCRCRCRSIRTNRKPQSSRQRLNARPIVVPHSPSISHAGIDPRSHIYAPRSLDEYAHRPSPIAKHIRVLGQVFLVAGPVQVLVCAGVFMIRPRADALSPRSCAPSVAKMGGGLNTTREIELGPTSYHS